MRYLRLIALLATILLMTSTVVFAGNNGTTRKKGSPAPTAAAGKGEHYQQEILKASSVFFAGFPFVNAEDVYDDSLNGGSTDYLLLSVQSADEFARGHVPGAVNVPLHDLTDERSRQQLPRDKRIVLISDDGHQAMAAALFLSQLGFDTAAMSMGLSHWNSNESGISAPYPGSAGYPVSLDNVTASSSNKLPSFNGHIKNGSSVIENRTKAIFSSKRSLFVDRSQVYEKAVKGRDQNYVLVSLQRPEDYAKGHVPGAINIPVKEIATAESLRKLPRHKKVILICYIGHWGGAAALLLNQLGYEAYDMRFGTMGWNDTTDGLGGYKEAMRAMGTSKNYPIERSSGKK